MNFLKCILTFLTLLPAGVAYGQPAATFGLSTVRINDGPFLRAQQTDLRYILSLDPDRLLVPFMREAGLQTNVQSYGNWENTGLDGHIGGHYLSALALMVASTGDREAQRRLEYMLNKLAQCQEQNGDGYIGGIPNGKKLWEEIRQGTIESDNFSLNKRWVPLYNIHKLFAGLYDAAVIAQNKNAREMFIRLCDWFVTLMSPLSDGQIQQILKSEHGGMNEVLALATELTNDKRYLELAKRFSHRVILEPLVQKQDKLTGLHANTQIPKVIGFKKIADLSHDHTWKEAAEFFWQTVVHHRTVSIGGNSVREHFHPATDFSSMVESNQGPETCNTYNMLKLTKALYETEPDAHYLDYYERAMYNHILSSQHPDGGFVYFTPMRPRHYRVYSSINDSFWCCVGSGLENHGKFGELIYAHRENELFVNLFIPSTVQWAGRKITLKQETEFPFKEETSITLSLKGKSRFAMKVRHPSWIPANQMKVTVNGKAILIESTPSSYATIERVWSGGDVIKISLPMHTEVERMPDNSAWISFAHGPIVLAAATENTDLKGLRADGSRMGHVAEGKFYPVEEAPVVVTDGERWLSKIQAIPGEPLTFSMKSVLYPPEFGDLKLVPFFSLHDQRYMLYWPVAGAGDLENVKATLTEKNKANELFRIRIIDEVRLGEQQPEVEHNFIGETTETGTSNGEPWRVTRKSMSFELHRNNMDASILRVVGGREVLNHKPEITVNGRPVSGSREVPSNQSDLVIFDYPLDSEMASADKLVVRFTASGGHDTGRIFRVVLLKP